MTRNSLPTQIVVLISLVLFSVLTLLWVSLFSVRIQMDGEAAEESKIRMDGRFAAFQEQVSLIASDYHNWTDLFLKAQHLDYDRLSSNYGITAHRGDVFQYAELFDGPFPYPVSWSVGLGLSHQEGILSYNTRKALRDRVFKLDYTERETADYYEIRDGKLVMFSASYLLPEDASLLSDVQPTDQAVGTIGKVLAPMRLAQLEQEFSITDLEIVTDSPLTGLVNIAVLGVSEQPVAWLQWSPPTPGTMLFWKMVPIMSGVSITFMLVSFFGGRVVRDKARSLIAQEAVSFVAARTDALTRLPNRLALVEHFKELNERRDGQRAIVAIDLVKFKGINDTVGHQGGDIFLSEFADRLSSLADETTFVARYSGDEFCISILTADGLDFVVEEKCRLLSHLCTKQIQCKGVFFDVLASKGVAIDESSDLAMEELLDRADHAMYHAKISQSQTAIRYNRTMEAQDTESKRVETELRRALITGDEFAVEYQPIVSARNPRRIVQVEALARWSNAKLGRVSPDKFIPIAEKSGLILSLGWALLDVICRDSRRFGDLVICVNVSPAQLMVPGFANEFAKRLSTNGVVASQIKVEVTEQMVVLNDVTIANELLILKNRGMSLALDDFGTGYSSIGYLTRAPFDVLKIDQSFVKSMSDKTGGTKMLKSMVGLAKSMDLKIVAEGIETASEADLLTKIGADYLQGYFFGRPAKPEQIELRSETSKVRT